MLQQYLRVAASRGRATTQVGPFLVTVDERTSSPFLSYAVPDDDAAPTEQDIRALIDAFTSRGRIPRLEYLEPTAPLVLPALEAAGFAVEGRLRAMTATTAAAPALPEDYAVVVPEGDDDRTAMLAVQHRAFGDDAPPGPGALAASRESEAAGTLVLAVRAPDGSICAGGVATPPQGLGVTEVAGIAVAPAHRRRGIASALSAELTRRMVAAGVRTAFLTPGDDGAARAYERAGFRTVGRMLHVRKE